MAKLTLEIEYDYDFLLIGISSHEKDYRMCWAVNNALSIQLQKTTSLEIKDKKQIKPASYSIYMYNHEEAYCEYFIINNRSEHNLLIPELKQCDYFLMVKGTFADEEKNTILKKIKAINLVLTALMIDPNTLKSKQNFVF